ncbi:unnamed protein product [Zymoseptoria tritici ST99CH_3D1]|nr:unnamed protein product [Zymoseptoria tritici ST99CH_3D1]
MAEPGLDASSSTALPPFLQLPDELITSIFQLIPKDILPANKPSAQHPHLANYQTFSSLARICKRFSIVARPLLYTFITTEHVSWRVSERDWYTDESVDLHRLVRTLCEKPYLARFIRGLRLPGCRSRRWEHTPVVVNGELFRETIVRVVGGGELCESIMHALEWGCEAAYVTILMMLAPNVKSFDMDWQDDDRHRFHGGSVGRDCLNKTVSVLFRHLQAARAKESIPTIEDMGLQNLHTCNLQDLSPAELASIISIPSLRTVKASFFHRDPKWHVVPEFTAGPSGVTSLELTDSMVDPRWMETIVRGCRNLQNFTYKIVQPPNLSQHHPQTVNPETIGAVLDGLQHSLMTLRIIDATEAGYVFHASRGALGSLAEFHCLTDLEIDEEAFFGMPDNTYWMNRIGYIPPDLDFFPPNLKTLTYHTYAWAHCVPDLLWDLGELADRGLDELIISCPTDKENRFRPDRILNMDYFKPVQELIGKPDRGEDLLIKHRYGFDFNSGRDRMDFQLRSLQTRTYPNVRETADMLWDHGVWGVLTYQAELPQVWEDETVYGEALTSMFEETDGADEGETVAKIADVVASL